MKEEVGVPQHKVPAKAALLITRRGRPQKPEQRRLSPRHHPISPSPVSAQTVLSKSKIKDTKSKMKLSSALGFALVLAIILVILTPEVNICLRKEFASGKKFRMLTIQTTNHFASSTHCI